MVLSTCRPNAPEWCTGRLLSSCLPGLEISGWIGATSHTYLKHDVIVGFYVAKIRQAWWIESALLGGFLQRMFCQGPLWIHWCWNRSTYTRERDHDVDTEVEVIESKQCKILMTMSEMEASGRVREKDYTSTNIETEREGKHWIGLPPSCLSYDKIKDDNTQSYLTSRQRVKVPFMSC